MGDGALEAGFEEEEGGPAGGVADQVGREAAVEGGEGMVGAGEGAEDGDGCWGCGSGGEDTAVDLMVLLYKSSKEGRWVRTLHACLDDVERVHG